MDVAGHVSAHRTTDPAYLEFYQVVVAACMVLAPLTLATWSTLCPQYRNPARPSQGTALDAFRQACPLAMQLFLLSNVVAPYVYPISYIGLGLLAVKRSPWLVTTGMIRGWARSIPWGFIADQVFLTNEMARLGNDALFTTNECCEPC